MRPLCAFLPLLACLGTAQGVPPAQEPARSRPAPPILLALDADKDGELSAAEIAQASAALRKLDRNGDGRLTPDEYRPPRPEGQGAPPSQGEGEARGPRVPGGDGERREARAPRPEGQGGRPQLDRPRPLLDTALDEDGDEIISAAEIAKAPALLRKLDKNGDGRLSREELRPRPAGGAGQGQGPERPTPRPGQGDAGERPAPTAPAGGRP